MLLCSFQVQKNWVIKLLKTLNKKVLFKRNTILHTHTSLESNVTPLAKWPKKSRFQWGKLKKHNKTKTPKEMKNSNYEKRSYIHFSCSAETWFLSSVKKPGEINKNNSRNAVECHDVMRRLQTMSFLWFQLTINYLLSHKL